MAETLRPRSQPDDELLSRLFGPQAELDRQTYEWKQASKRNREQLVTQMRLDVALGEIERTPIVDDRPEEMPQ